MIPRTRRRLLTVLAAAIGAFNGFACSIVAMVGTLIVGRAIAVEDDSLRPWAEPFFGLGIVLISYVLPIGLTLAGAGIAGVWFWRRSAPQPEPQAEVDPSVSESTADSTDAGNALR